MTSKLYPYAGRHAVQSAAFVLSFRSDLTPGQSEAAAVAHELLQDIYPSKDPVQTISFQVGPAGPAVSSSKTVGWNFTRPLPVEKQELGKAVFQRAVHLQGSDLAIVENDYDRWAGFRTNVFRCLDALGPTAFNGRSLASMALQYTDIFTWKDDPSMIDAGGVFAKTSKLLPAHVFEVASKHFHATHGYFNPDVPEGAESLLENVSVARTPNVHTLQDQFVITIEHRLVPSGEYTSADEARELIEMSMEALHQRNKASLADLLTPELRDLIRLGV